MLRVTTVSAGHARYYTGDPALELGPAGAVGLASFGLDHRGPPPPGAAGCWVGSAAAGIGLTGFVTEDAFVAVLEGRMPGATHALRARAGRVAAYDLTFSAPKSASVLFALGSHEVAAAVVAAHSASVCSAIDYLDRHVVSVRRGTGEHRAVLAADGSIAGAFTHGVSRALDPHVHTHLVVANVAHGTDGRWSALDGRSLFAHRAAIGQLYECELRGRLRIALGVRWERTARGGMEVAGIDPVLIGAFSNRSAELRSALAGRLAPSWREREIVRLTTREPKTASERRELVHRWRANASGSVPGLRLDDVLGRTSVSTRSIDEFRFAAALVTSPHASATRRAVVGAWAGAVDQGTKAHDVESSADLVIEYGSAAIRDRALTPSPGAVVARPSVGADRSDRAGIGIGGDRGAPSSSAALWGTARLVQRSCNSGPTRRTESSAIGTDGGSADRRRSVK